MLGCYLRSGYVLDQKLEHVSMLYHNIAVRIFCLDLQGV
jgi:hypothetical protein